MSLNAVGGSRYFLDLDVAIGIEGNIPDQNITVVSARGKATGIDNGEGLNRVGVAEKFDEWFSAVGRVPQHDLLVARSGKNEIVRILGASCGLIGRDRGDAEDGLIVEVNVHDEATRSEDVPDTALLVPPAGNEERAAGAVLHECETLGGLGVATKNGGERSS